MGLPVSTTFGYHAIHLVPRILVIVLVVSSKVINPAFNQNQSELGVLVLLVPLQMLSNSNNFLNHVVQILRNLRYKP